MSIETKVTAAFERLNVSADSPDHTVTVHISHAEAMRVTFDESKLARHSQQSLGRQLSAALSGAQRGYGDGLSQLRDMTGRTETGQAEESSAESERRTRLIAETRQLTAEAASPNGTVRIRYSGEGDVSVELHPRGLEMAQQRPGAFGREVADALRDAQQRYMDMAGQFKLAFQKGLI